MEKFNKLCLDFSKKVTNDYSTSFSLGIYLIKKNKRQDIYNIYAFSRFSDEIVDTFNFDKDIILDNFKKDTYNSIKNGISVNPVLNSFQKTIINNNIDLGLVDSFFDSMEMDLYIKDYTYKNYDKYILGSAQVIGLMCLKVFLNNQKDYDNLKFSAMSLGSAFQKVNFLRDIKSDFDERKRLYFPNIRTINDFNETIKDDIKKDIIKDFQNSVEGIMKLPRSVGFGVYTSYLYYYALFRKIITKKSQNILKKSIQQYNQFKHIIYSISFI